MRRSAAYLRGEQAISRRLIGSSRSRNYVVFRKRKPAPPIYGLSKGRLGAPGRYRNARPCRSPGYRNERVNDGRLRSGLAGIRAYLEGITLSDYLRAERAIY